MTRYKSTPEGNIPFTPEEEAEWDALVKEAAIQAPFHRAAAIREERNRLLAETDWMASTDVTMSDEWRAYREALREVPEEPTFPDKVIWPKAPQ